MDSLNETSGGATRMVIIGLLTLMAVVGVGLSGVWATSASKHLSRANFSVPGTRMLQRTGLNWTTRIVAGSATMRAQVADTGTVPMSVPERQATVRRMSAGPLVAPGAPLLTLTQSRRT